MTDELTAATEPEAQADTSAPSAAEEADESGAQTVAEVEAYWKKRVSNKDVAHAEAEKVLRQQLAEARKQVSQSAQERQSSGDSGEQEAAARIAGLEAQLAEQRVETLKVKYPALAEQVGTDDTIFKATDEATLAKLNASIGAPGSGSAPVIDHSTPRRPPATGPKPTGEKTATELEADLRKFGPEWVEAVRSGI